MANKKLRVHITINSKITVSTSDNKMVFPIIKLRKTLIICVKGLINTIVSKAPVKPSRGNNAVLKKKNGNENKVKSYTTLWKYVL
jgi:hypothetical protein